MDKTGVLKQYFGHEHFKEGQEQIIDSILSGRDALAIMPTGGGKSLCYQVPALLFDGLTLVISPLISLMTDQVMALRDAGVPAAFINSSLSEAQLKTVYSRMRERAYKIIYVAPERLTGEGFLAQMQSLSPEFVAVDEAHCVSQWGQDFRPSYLKIADFIARLKSRPVVAAFTATATKKVREDIVEFLKLERPHCVITGFDRPNLFFDVLKPKNKLTVLKTLVAERRDKSGVIYCATRARVEELCASLNEMGIPATRYHAGLADSERQRNQEDFQYDRRPVMVATNAFGMGIDKSNISFVIHYNMPKNLEAYYQEAGRAGRDGERAECILLYSPGDISTAKYMIENGSVNDELSEDERWQLMQEDYRRLDDMVKYCKTSSCLREYILNYFGQKSPASCGNCGSCVGEYSQENITVYAQMILSCIKRVRDYLGYSVGASLITRVLHGAGDKRVRELRLDRLSTYALMKDVPRAKINEYVDFLESEGYLRTNQTHRALELTEKSQEVLFDGDRVEMSVKRSAPEPKAVKTRQSRERASPEAPSELLESLKALRYRIAQEEGVPAYIVFSNSTLADMAARQPLSMVEFLAVNGVGEVKAKRYGRQFLEAIAEFVGGEA